MTVDTNKAAAAVARIRFTSKGKMPGNAKGLSSSNMNADIETNDAG